MAGAGSVPFRYAFVFVCQHGALELPAMLLAASLRRYLRCAYDLVAAVPVPPEQWGCPAEATCAFFQRQAVRLCLIENGFDPPYPLGNKIACLEVPTQADKIVFLDTDMLCLREFCHDERFRLPVNVKPADLATFTKDLAIWERTYWVAAGLGLPAARVRATYSGEEMPPYFNTGFVAVRRGLGLSDPWRACCRAIAADEVIRCRPHWLEQSALPVALAKLGLSFDCVDEAYNYPAHLRRLSARRLPIFCHYHTPEVIDREPILRRLVRSLAEENPEIRARLAAEPKWQRLLKPVPPLRRLLRWFCR